MRSVRKGLQWWLIFSYVALLPYAILLFNGALRWLPLSVIKSASYVVFACILAWLAFDNSRGNFLKRTVLFVQVAVILVFVTILEPNSIKYLHIPEFALLAHLIYRALSSDSEPRKEFLLATFFCVILLGIFDEIHHGAHPDRYFGWKDMVINASGGLIGIIIVNSRASLSGPMWPKQILKTPKLLLLLGISNVWLAFSVLYLLDGSMTNSLNLELSPWLLSGGAISLTSLIGSVWSVRTSKIEKARYYAFILIPAAALFLSHSTLLLVAAMKAPFQ